MSILTVNDDIKKLDIKKSTFDLSHFNATTGKIGELIPVLCEECVPGDEFNIRMQHLLRFLPLAGPLTQRVDMYLHAFFVANRTLFAEGEWNNFITGKSLSNLLEIDLYGTGVGVDGIGNYFGIPNNSYFSVHKIVNKMPLWAYLKIYNDYYRNKMVQEKLDYDDYNYGSKLLLRNWRKDYFTSGLYTPQYGSPSRISLDIDYLAHSHVKKESGLNATDSALLSRSGDLYTNSNNDLSRIENLDLSSSGIDVNDIRYAFAYQDFLVRVLKAGDEYQDTLLLLFGVETKDDRLQMAEYIGGYSAPIIINEVTSMSEVLDSSDVVVSPLATQAGTGYSFGNSDQVYYKVPEHGYIMVILSVVPKSIHYGGFDRKMLKLVPLDFYFPQFANLPEQAIENQEIYWSNSADDVEPFAYIERYAEYKHRNDRISGEMCGDFNHMHFSNIYSTLPTLGDTFLKCDVREDAFAVSGSIHFFGQIGFDIEAKRPMPYDVNNLIALY